MFNTSAEKLKHSFTFVTDCAAKMAAIFGVSISPSPVPFLDRWIACISHQFKTAIKHAVDNYIDNLFKNELECHTKLVTYFK